jgi:3-aminobutyryl-CoA ammonia-lyase
MAETTNTELEVEGFLRVRLGTHDTHYHGGLIPAATIMRLFADCSSEIGLRVEGQDGYLAAYEKVEFFKPLYAGDYVEVRAKRVSKGNRSRRVFVEARRCIERTSHPSGLSGGVVHNPPELIAHAYMIGVSPKQD